MGFRAWKRWVGSLPWSLRWFVFLILLRPFIDSFYYLKEISPFLSPLYIVGGLTPVFIIASLCSKTVPPRKESLLDPIFMMWGFLLFFNVLALLTIQISIRTIEMALKLIMPVLIYFFVRHLIRSKRDLLGILTTFLYSAIFPFAMMLYGRFISPFEVINKTRGFQRYDGLYADVMTYGVYVSGTFLIACYFFLRHSNSPSVGKHARRFAIVCVLVVVGLVTMHHATSWGVCVAILVLFLLHSLDSSRISVLALAVLIGILGFSLVGDKVSKRVWAMYDSEVAVVQGRKPLDNAFHGRMGRWQRMVAYWEQKPAVARWLGVSITSQVPETSLLISGPHNDYLRIIFASGLIGFFAYLLFHLGIFMNSWQVPKPERFLILSGMAVILLYSVTLTPTTYVRMMYIYLSIFAYAALPEHERQPVHTWGRVHPGRSPRGLRPARQN